MRIIALALAMLACLPTMSSQSLAGESFLRPYHQESPRSDVKGLPVFIQIFKEERLLELYVQQHGKYRLLKSYPICKYSGGLGPKKTQGDLKSPEGFYKATLSGLNPNSRFYQSINVGYPNAYDRYRGYDGNYLMIHGECTSVGCYAMTNQYIEEIYSYVEASLRNGQSAVDINIYPFRMTAQNMNRHRNSSYHAFWKELQPAYEYFEKNKAPAQVDIIDGRYVFNKDSFPMKVGVYSSYALTKVE